MPDDPMLSQEEIDALLRSMGEAVAEAQPAAVRPDLVAAPAPLPLPAPPPRLRDPAAGLPDGVRMLLDVDVTCTVELGTADLDLGELLSLRRSSLIVLSGRIEEMFVLRVNGVPFARGTIVETDGRYGLQIVALAQPKEGGQAS